MTLLAVGAKCNGLIVPKDESGDAALEANRFLFKTEASAIVPIPALARLKKCRRVITFRSSSSKKFIGQVAVVYVVHALACSELEDRLKPGQQTPRKDFQLFVMVASRFRRTFP